MKKISEFLSGNFQSFGGEIFNIFEYACFRNGPKDVRVIEVRLYICRLIWVIAFRSAGSQTSKLS